MAATDVDICNGALIKLGAARIGSLGDDTKAAILCNDRYNPLRKEVLRSHPWNFAITRSAALTPIADSAVTFNDPDFDFDNAFTIPSDCLRVIRVDRDVDQPWQVEGRIVRANGSLLTLYYIKDVTDTTVFDPNFDEVLSARIAADIAYALAQSLSLQERMFALYRALLSQARSFDAQEGQLLQVGASEWVDVRF